MLSEELTLPLFIIESAKLKEKQYYYFNCEYMGDVRSAFLFRFEGVIYSYLNQCVHMPFQLNCQKDTVFSESKTHLKCSMHGIVYNPVTGESLSPTMCTGEKLTAIEIVESKGDIWAKDINVQAILDIESSA
ncbi:Rieske (2Fe-2S) protein [Psychromonas sp. KJ10-10]|uniref:Rieske (2Fe-2S) protein n=1 Tax=Psychromonas sp. KJ10-10 TaxID=3391823 RepID=UPI0039B6A3FD